jgi:epoxyqueuosine reductase
VAAYAWPRPGSAGSGDVGPGGAGRGSGWDYHDRARGLLRDAEARLRAAPGLADLRFYGFADTAPVFERDLASEAGLGWRGKNGCTLSRARGSAFHLAGFLIDLELPAATPLEEFCGGCTRCLDQCPTGAFRAPGVLDATRCISYWTIESRAPAPASLAGGFGGWIFGCDVCQEVCPWNRKHLAAEPRLSAGSEPRPEAGGRGTARDSGTGPGTTEPSSPFPGDAGGWLDLLRQGGGFRSRFKDSPLARAGRRGLLRNLATAMGNLGDTSARDKLREVLEAERDPALREVLARALSTLEALEAAPQGPEAPPAP